MKKQSYLPLTILLLSLLFNGVLSAQELKKSDLINEQTGYISGICASPNDSLYAFSVASWRTLILDHSFKPIRQFEYFAMWGGGGPSFSYDNQYLSFKTFGEPDTLFIYSLNSPDSTMLTMDVQTVQFFNTSNDVLTMWNGYFSIYNLATEKLTKDVVNVGQNRTEFSSYFYLTSNDSLLIATSSDFTLDIYTTKDWKIKETLFQADEEISDVTGNDERVAFSVNNVVYIYDLQSKKEVASFSTPMGYIGDLTLVGDDLYIAGTEYNFVIKYNITTAKTSKVAKLKHKRKKSFSVKPLKDGRVLIGDYSHLRLYYNE